MLILVMCAIRFTKPFSEGNRPAGEAADRPRDRSAGRRHRASERREPREASGGTQPPEPADERAPTKLPRRAFRDGEGTR